MKENISINCRVCSSKDYTFLFNAKNTTSNTDINFEYYQCKKCKTIFIGKIPIDMNNFYNEDYHPFTSKTKLDTKDKKNINSIRKLSPNYSVLELGIGNGKFIEYLNNTGHKCYCIEPYSKITNQIRKKNINIISSTLEKLNIDDLNFKVDIIYSWHSIEHLNNFPIFLKLCEKILNKGGYVIIGTPNQKSLSFKYYKQYWYHLQPPLHSFLITNDEMEKQFNAINFIKIKFSSRDKMSIISSKYGWETSGFLLKKKSGKKIDSYLGKFLSFFMPFIEAILNRSSQYTIIFKRSQN